MDLSKLSDADLMALKAGDLTKMSDAGLAHMKAQGEAKPSRGVMGAVGDAAAGLVRGAGSIGATLLASPADLGVALGVRQRQGGSTDLEQRRTAMDGGLRELGADTDSLAFKGGKLTAEVAGTLGAGGAVANGLSTIPRVAAAAPNLLQAIRTSGMAAGGGPAMQNALLRAAGGNISGAAGAGLVEPEQAALGGAIGAALPPIMQGAGKIGQGVAKLAGRPFQSMSAPTGAALADVLGISEQQLAAVMKAAAAAPNEIVPGSKLTLSQALQYVGVNEPGIKLLERTVAGGPGGDELLKRYASQDAARLETLKAQGAETYQGAAKDVANRAGDKIGAVLRTQAGDDKAAARAAWEGVYGRMADEGASLYLPLDELSQAMRPLGRGTVGAGKDAAALVREAQAIGRVEGAAPAAGKIPVPVPFEEFQRLRRSAGALGAKVGSREGGEVEAAVLADIQALMTAKADAAAAGRLRPGETMTSGASADYNAARSLTRENAERYKGGNAISAILRKPVGQDYKLTGDEIFNKLWHGGGGLAGDVADLKGVLSANNYEPSLNALRQAVLTEAASKTTASGSFGAALPKYVESRLPGLQEALTPDQLKTITSVATDIRNAEAAGSIAGLRGSDTQAKLTRALDAGLVDGPLLKTLARLLSVKGVGLESLRAKVAQVVANNKGADMAKMLADPSSAALSGGSRMSENPLARLVSPGVRQFGYRAAPALATGQ